MRGLGSTLALSAVAAIAIGSCGFGAPSPGPTPDQLLKVAFQNLAKSSSYRVQGTYTSVFPRVDIDVTAVAPVRFVPVMRTLVPPVVVPVAGLTPVTVGAATAGVYVN